MIPCYKEHDKSFIWHYYTYDISKAILDLIPDLYQNFLFFVTLSILHIHICMMPLMKAELQGFISYFHLRAVSNIWVRYDTKTEKSRRFVLATVSFLHIESSAIPPLKASMKGFISSPTPMSYEQYMKTLWPKNMKVWWFKCALYSLIHLICSKRLIFETTS